MEQHHGSSHQSQGGQLIAQGSGMLTAGPKPFPRSLHFPRVGHLASYSRRTQRVPRDWQATLGTGSLTSTRGAVIRETDCNPSQVQSPADSVWTRHNFSRADGCARRFTGSFFLPEGLDLMVSLRWVPACRQEEAPLGRFAGVSDLPRHLDREGLPDRTPVDGTSGPSFRPVRATVQTGMRISPAHPALSPSWPRQHLTIL